MQGTNTRTVLLLLIVCLLSACNNPNLDGPDNCPELFNPDQTDTDGDGDGDDCDADDDGDGQLDAVDPCPRDPDDDVDADGFCADADNCPTDPNPGQADTDGDNIGDVCDV